MNSKKLLVLVLGVVSIVSIAFFVVPSYIEKQNAVTNEVMVKTIDDNKLQESSSTDIAGVATTGKSADIPQESVVTQLQSKPPVVIPKTPPAVVPSKPESLYTKTTVATHNSEASCWSIINGGVYDLTSFVGDHPGGDRNILKICGKDGSSAFTSQHGGDSKPEKTLAKFFLAPLSN